MEGLRVAKADLRVFVHPSQSSNLLPAVRRRLGSLLFKYYELFDGVLLSHEFSIEDDKAIILPGITPFFGAKVKAKLLLFSPKPDLILEGKVVKIGADSIHAVVLGFASAAILKDDIRDEFKYKEKSEAGAFVSRLHKKHAIKVGSMIRFSVKSVDEELIHVNGSLIQPNTGCLRWLYKHQSDDASHDRSKKRHRDAKSDKFDENGDKKQRHKSSKTYSHE
ncbi:DNA-directed RNA polymerase [Rhynchospora pubera]|uniref:DNA-directed RNA polymerase subunit n=1 Tax=Rhynchospora pubera TaxID=906938 RepID=A0AAV8ELG2_9POAL|nr:DNA-directed RNA polymerase [Rhynchospora pubera]